MTTNDLKSKLRGAFKSLTIWVNTIIGFALYNADTLQQALPQLAPYIPPAKYQQLVFWVLLLNVALRFKTKQPLAAK